MEVEVHRGRGQAETQDPDSDKVYKAEVNGHTEYAVPEERPGKKHKTHTIQILKIINIYMETLCK